MAYSEAVLHRARERLLQEKNLYEAETAARRAQVLQAYPRLKEIDQALRQSVAGAVAAAFRKGEDTTAAIAALKEKNLALQREREWILASAELDESVLDPPPFCPHCGGSGYVGSSMCECLRELCRQEQKKELSSLLGGKESFDGFRLDLYSTEPDPNLGVSPRQLMERTFRRCRRYAREFGAGAPSLLFTGGPGLGKTFLSACIARAVADNGFSVVYDTAGKLFSDFEAVKFGGNQQDLTRKYLQCDLLIIDDLGTEMTTQFTQSVLYRVLNDRLLENRPVIVSTNLSDQALRQRYSAPIASRLLGAFEVCLFLGQDIRQLRP
ncbi:MAG TPA: ATP-binding protein [Candidatus Avoscillospira stercoripullorum]|uniref:ATP-binding protein n=1 Tax=Candidatus Avoscillospira stercoripullorum TaxID=2840709 RepID=A0A9D1A5Y8_9FIRM|nr:ATP-binding protein [Candidatus Avoscillospira stercoripullorum]